MRTTTSGLRFTVIVLVSLAVTTTALAQAWKGRVRMSGMVTDQDRRPIAGATITMKFVSEGAGPPPFVTDRRGRWNALSLAEGHWHIDIVAEGYTSRHISIRLNELDRLPPLTIDLTPAPPDETPAASSASTGAAPDAATAITEADRLLAGGKFQEAIAAYDKAEALQPGDDPRITRGLAQAWYGAGDLKKSNGYLGRLHAQAPNDHDVAILYGTRLLEEARVDEARKVLEALPQSAFKDAATVAGIGVLYLNQNQAETALRYLDRAIAIDAGRGASFYYRGLARMRLEQKEQAKQDLEKAIALAPDSDEANDARELLKAMK